MKAKINGAKPESFVCGHVEAKDGAIIIRGSRSRALRALAAKRNQPLGELLDSLCVHGVPGPIYCEPCTVTVEVENLSSVAYFIARAMALSPGLTPEEIVRQLVEDAVRHVHVHPENTAPVARMAFQQKAINERVAKVRK